MTASESVVSASPTQGMSGATVRLGRIYAAALVVWAVVYPQLDKVNSRFAGSVMNVVGAALILIGLFAFAKSRWAGASLVIVGSVLGTLTCFWAVAPLIAMIALIVLIVKDARRAPSV